MEGSATLCALSQGWNFCCMEPLHYSSDAQNKQERRYLRLPEHPLSTWPLFYSFANSHSSIVEVSMCGCWGKQNNPNKQKPVPALWQRGELGRTVINQSSCSRDLTPENPAKPQGGWWSKVNTNIN